MDIRSLIKKGRDYCSLEQDDYFRKQVEALISENAVTELNDRFYTDLEFGTGGLRGIIGGGYNRMNPYTVKKATQGLANYIKKNSGNLGDASVVIAYDSRNFSDLFSLKAALVLCANGIRTYLFTALRPTPELSFAVRRLKATAGIVLTASHNPAEYNGFKAYWNDGGQVVPPHDKGIIEEARAVSGPIAELAKEEAIEKGILVMIDKEIDEPFIDMVTRHCLRPSLVREMGSRLTVVYTPLNGAGRMPVERVLRRLGVNVTLVPEQQNPDGSFATVTYPNPEEASAMKLALDLGKSKKADLVMGTDPDADRLGIAAPDGDDFRLITGNELGALLLDYILNSRKELGILPKNGAVIKTIVTTELQRCIAESYGISCFDVLTGFKYIGEKMRLFDSIANGPVFLFGSEESYGYLTTPEVRDKDAVSAACMSVEMTLYHLSRGRTLLDQLKALWIRYGYFKEVGISSYFKGEAGLCTMQRLMETLRNDPPANFAGQTILTIKDFRAGVTMSLQEGKKAKNIDLPPSNVLQYHLADKTIVTARPSGTEPKIKFYISCRGAPNAALEGSMDEAGKKIEAIKTQINHLIEKA